MKFLLTSSGISNTSIHNEILFVNQHVVVLIHRDNHFSLSVSFFKIPVSLSSLRPGCKPGGYRGTSPRFGGSSVVRRSRPSEASRRGT